MEKFEYNGQMIEYTLERKKIKNMYISIKEGNVIVKVPKRTSEVVINQLLEKRSEWILKNLKKYKKQEPKKYCDGENFKVLGKDIQLRIFHKNIRKPEVELIDNYLNITLPINSNKIETDQIKREIDKFYSELAQSEVSKAMKKMTLLVRYRASKLENKEFEKFMGKLLIYKKY